MKMRDPERYKLDLATGRLSPYWWARTQVTGVNVIGEEPVKTVEDVFVGRDGEEYVVGVG